jgi:integrase
VSIPSRTRRAYAQRGARPRKQRALTKDPLQALLATCDETLRGQRDRALLLFAWATGGRRRPEVAAATMENLRRVDAARICTPWLTPRPTRRVSSDPRT